MDTRHSHAPSRKRTPALALLGLLALCAFFSGGCAVLPFAFTTAASFAMPQTASLAMSGVKSVYQTAQLAADERDLNTIMRDNMLTLKAKSALLTEKSASDVQVYVYAGDLFAVGQVENSETRDHVVSVLQGVKGVHEVKGVLRLRDLEAPDTRQSDQFLENSTRLALGRYLLHKNVGVHIDAVQGELCLTGVVGTHAEALDLIQYVESVSGTRAMSLLAIRDEYASGRKQTNERYLLGQGTHEVRGSVAPPPAEKPRTDIAQVEPARTVPDSHGEDRLPDHPIAFQLAQAEPEAPQPMVWNKARMRLGERLTFMAKRENAPAAKAELLTLARHITTDRDLSIADRLSVAADQATHQHSRAKIQSLLALF